MVSVPTAEASYCVDSKDCPDENASYLPNTILAKLKSECTVSDDVPRNSKSSDFDSRRIGYVVNSLENYRRMIFLVDCRYHLSGYFPRSNF
ncbi:hypothetical protein YC2023_019092 [Brassica napus]